jgi:pimeloyl-ACP methyl ester carboxylesterase
VPIETLSTSAVRRRDPAGRRIVLVHGAPDRAASFTGVMTLLDDLPILAYDRLGYGHRSLAPGAADPDLDDHADDLLAIIDGAPSVVVGHSFGGLVAMVAATRPGAPITALGLWEPPMTWDDWWPDPAMGPAIRAVAEAADTDELGERHMRRVLGEEAWAALSPAEQERYRAEGRGLRADMRAVEHTPFEVARVGRPSTVGLGQRPGPYPEVARRLAAELGADLVEASGTAHLVHLTHPARFARFIRDVVAGAPEDRAPAEAGRP